MGVLGKVWEHKIHVYSIVKNIMSIICEIVEAFAFTAPPILASNIWNYMLCTYKEVSIRILSCLLNNQASVTFDQGGWTSLA